MLCSTKREEVERKLEEWRKAIEERGLKISRKKTEYWSSSEQQDLVIRLEGEEVKRVKTFKYLGSTLAEDGAFVYGAETWAVKKVHKKKIDVAEMAMLRWMCGVTRLDKI